MKPADGSGIAGSTGGYGSPMVDTQTLLIAEVALGDTAEQRSEGWYQNARLTLENGVTEDVELGPYENKSELDKLVKADNAYAVYIDGAYDGVNIANDDTTNDGTTKPAQKSAAPTTPPKHPAEKRPEDAKPTVKKPAAARHPAAKRAAKA